MSVAQVTSFKLTLSYDGTAYSGWQAQADGNTIQQWLAAAIKSVVGSQVQVTGSGRTDAGVHALGQVASFSVPTRIAAGEMQNAINANLPGDIRVLAAEEVAASFCAQRSATSKRYVYVLQDGPLPDVIRQRYCWFLRGTLDVAAMQQAAGYLVGELDFASFQAAGSERASTVRHVSRLQVERRANEHRGTTPDDIVAEIAANGFLYRMVRNIVGTLADVGLGKQPPDWVADVLAACDRDAAGRTAPPQGLFLAEVNYN